jgi:hypothetical protein
MIARSGKISRRKLQTAHVNLSSTRIAVEINSAYDQAAWLEERRHRSISFISFGVWCGSDDFLEVRWSNWSLRTLSARADHLGAGRRIGESLSREWRIRDRGWILIG